MNFFDKCSSTEIRAAAAKTTGPWKSFFKDNRTRPLLGHVNQIRIDSVAHVVQANTVMPYGSPFLDSSTHSSAGSLAILYLRRDLLIPVLLGRSSAGSEQEDSAREDGKEEEEVDRVVHTRFGSYPHSQLIGVAWGSQIAAKKVETDGRGRKRRKRRKLGDGAERNEAATDTRVKTGENVADDGGHVERDRGFIYILKPTPELWAQCLPHRTQIIYTPDYSYIIFRLHMRPGEVVLEAGAGSGSFTHAAARAIFNGFPPLNQGDRFDDRRHCHRYGRIYSFECFEPRAAALRKEIKQHGLDRVVSILDRDVCKDGFRVADGETGELQFQADAIFLDMPTPWCVQSQIPLYLMT